jgi:hypothetical protein
LICLLVGWWSGCDSEWLIGWTLGSLVGLAGWCVGPWGCQLFFKWGACCGVVEGCGGQGCQMVWEACLQSKFMQNPALQDLA